MTNTTCKVHGRNCERIHVGDVVRVVVGPQIGYMQLGTVISISPTGYIQVRFPDADDFDPSYSEAELEKTSV